MKRFEDLTHEELMYVDGGKDQDWYDMGKEIGSACRSAYEAAKDTVSDLCETVKGWF